MNEAAAEQYIDFSEGDPQLALKLQLGEYASVVNQFKHQFASYLKNEIDISKLCSSLAPVEVSFVRRLIRMVVTAYCYQFVGLNAKGVVSGVLQKPAAQKALLLASRLDRQLRVEESNLNLQIQLEDVLILLKQIIKFG
jgi:hypothetical protein